MAIWLLTRTDGVQWDENRALVVRAATAAKARETAAKGEAGGIYGLSPAVWISPKTSTCEKVLPEGTAAIILRDFNAG